MMRILMIIDGLSGGGAEKVVLTLCHGMQELGHQVSLFSLREACDYPIPLGIDYQVIADESRTPWRKLTELTRRADALDRAIIQSEVAQGAFDLVFSHLHKTDRIVSKSQRLDIDKVWFCIHGVLSTSYLGHRQGLNLWWKRHKMTRIYQQRNIVAVSQAVADDLQHPLAIEAQKLAVIHNPFDIAAIEQLAAAPSSRADRGYLVHVGRFHPNKRHDRLLRAYAKSGLTTPLLLIGTGDAALIDELKTLAGELEIAQRVEFLGFQANPYPYIKQAALLILSSDSEGFGNVLLEALLCGTPVVSTRCPGGPAEVLQRAGMPQALAELDVDSLSEKILEIYQHPPQIDHAGLLEYGLEPICQRYLELVGSEHHITDSVTANH